ncbi:MAG: arginine deiminase family protein [candidate division Zixibacteria bacterium]
MIINHTNCGGHSEVGKIESIILKHPKDAFISQENIDIQWKKLNYSSRPDYNKAIEEYDYFVSLLKTVIPNIHWLPRNESIGLDSIYVRDSMIATNAGIILCNMGKGERKSESAACRKYLSEKGIPILGEINGDGTVEGGDIIWLDNNTLVVGRGYRTNNEGIRQLKELTAEFIDEIIVVPLPHWRGPDDVFHLMSMISPVDDDLAVVYSRLLPVPFRERLIDRGIKLLEISDSEYETMACNILAVAPRKVIMLNGNPRTRQMLEAEGVEVLEYTGEEISQKGAGGPTCLTRPLFRKN